MKVRVHFHKGFFHASAYNDPIGFIKGIEKLGFKVKLERQEDGLYRINNSVKMNLTMKKLFELEKEYGILEISGDSKSVTLQN